MEVESLTHHFLHETGILGAEGLVFSVSPVKAGRLQRRVNMRKLKKKKIHQALDMHLRACWFPRPYNHT